MPDPERLDKLARQVPAIDDASRAARDIATLDVVPGKAPPRSLDTSLAKIDKPEAPGRFKPADGLPRSEARRDEGYFLSIGVSSPDSRFPFLALSGGLLGKTVSSPARAKRSTTGCRARRCPPGRVGPSARQGTLACAGRAASNRTHRAAALRPEKQRFALGPQAQAAAA